MFLTVLTGPGSVRCTGALLRHQRRGVTGGVGDASLVYSVSLRAVTVDTTYLQMLNQGCHGNF